MLLLNSLTSIAASSCPSNTPLKELPTATQIVSVLVDKNVKFGAFWPGVVVGNIATLLDKSEDFPVILRKGTKIRIYQVGLVELLAYNSNVKSFAFYDAPAKLSWIAEKTIADFEESSNGSFKIICEDFK